MKENTTENEIRRLIKKREEENEVFKKLLIRLEESNRKTKDKSKKVR